MTQRAHGQSESAVSLFPFLAVLLCTMGALIVLLVVLSRQARIEAGKSVADHAQARSEVATHLEDIRWRMAVFQESRAELQSATEDAQIELGYVEQQLRERRDNLERRKRQIAEVSKSDADRQHVLESLQANLVALQRRADGEENELKKIENIAKDRPPAYAVVPYDGTHKTQRRAIYLECLGDQVVLQPEGITLTEDDFQGPLGPANPLASLMRATAEYYISRYDDTRRPYPLLLVRPEGIGSYYAARQALIAWSTDFGYELIDSNWDLDFPETNKDLASVQLSAVSDARNRQRQLIAAMPRKFGRSDRLTFAAEFPGDPLLGSSAASASHGTVQRTGTAAMSVDTAAQVSGRSHGKPSADGKGSYPPNQSNLDELAMRQNENDNSDQVAGTDGDVPLAHGRGAGWGLPRSARGSLPVTRPVTVACHVDRFEIIPEDTSEPVRSINIGSRMEVAVDELVTLLWKRMEHWGPAGREMHWRPELRLFVARGGETLAARLSRLLEGSGIAVASVDPPMESRFLERRTRR